MLQARKTKGKSEDKNSRVKPNVQGENLKGDWEKMQNERKKGCLEPRATKQGTQRTKSTNDKKKQSRTGGW